MTKTEKEVLWMGSSLKDLRSFPDEVKQVFGAAIYYAQLGGETPAGNTDEGTQGCRGSGDC